ncbi:uncharacterized protein TNCV_221351 [Trichonephila clavipes]|nr:uncharacterized protein TNCV_221351 [Trichonephila clavipes]
MSRKAQRRGSDYRRKRKRFHANQYTRKVSNTLDVPQPTSSKYEILSKLLTTAQSVLKESFSPVAEDILPVREREIIQSAPMDLPPPVSQKSYERILRKINLASREVADDSMKNAAKGEVSASGSNEICVSGDGKVDVAALSSYCKEYEKWRGPKSGHSYEEWKLKHQPHCIKNHIGSSSKMEVDGMKEIFQRSVPQ